MLPTTGIAQKEQGRARGTDQSTEKGGLGCFVRELMLAVCGGHFL